MTERHIEKTLPIAWENWDQVDIAFFQFYNAEFLADWGPFKKGDKVDNIGIDFQGGRVVQYNDEGEEVVKVDVVLIPKV